MNLIENDRYSLNRFIKIQNKYFDKVCKELKNGKKESHWMWFMFPQLEALGFSEMSKFYGIGSISETKAYLENGVLRERLYCLVDILLGLNISDPVIIFGSIDSIKLRSSMTLFYAVSKNEKFKKVINRFFNGVFDEKTLEILNKLN